MIPIRSGRVFPSDVRKEIRLRIPADLSRLANTEFGARFLRQRPMARGKLLQEFDGDGRLMLAERIQGGSPQLALKFFAVKQPGQGM